MAFVAAILADGHVDIAGRYARRATEGAEQDSEILAVARTFIQGFGGRLPAVITSLRVGYLRGDPILYLAEVGPEIRFISQDLSQALTYSGILRGNQLAGVYREIHILAGRGG